MNKTPLYTYYPKTTSYPPRKPWERSFLTEYTYVERKRIKEDNTWKVSFTGSRHYTRVENRKCYVRKANISSRWLTEIRKQHPTSNIMISLPTHNSDVNSVITIFDESLKTPPDGMYINLIKPMKIRIMQPSSIDAIDTLFVDNYNTLDMYQWYKDYKPSRTNKTIITKYMSEILGTDPWLSELLTLPTIGAPQFLSYLPGIDMQMDVFGLSNHAMKNISDVLLKMVPTHFRVDIPKKLSFGWSTPILDGVKLRLSEKLYDTPFKIGSIPTSKTSVEVLVKRKDRNERSTILYGHPSFDVLESTIKYTNIPLYLTDEYFPFYTRDVSKIIPDDEIQCNVVWRHILSPRITAEKDYEKHVQYIKNEMVANWSGNVSAKDEEISLMFESTGGVEFINRLIQSSQSESRLSQHHILEEEDVKTVVKGVESSFTMLFADEEYRKRWVRKIKDEMHRREKKRSTNLYHTIEKMLIGEREGLSSDELYERTKNKWNNRKEYDNYMMWLKDTAHRIWEFKGKYRWL